jgi:parvulin-like peptidyl-prolyl isomerase
MKLINRIRLVFYGGIILYLLAEFFVIDGPMRRWLSSRGSKPLPTNISALVGENTISNAQVDRAISERLWLQGKSAKDLSPDELKLERRAALDELIERELLHLQAKAISPLLKVSDEEINERLRRLLGRFETKGAMETAMKSQGFSTEQELSQFLTDQIQQEKYIELRINSQIKVSDEEAQQWFAENQKSLSIPERIEVRHIFIPAMDHPLEESYQKLQGALEILTKKQKDFTTLAKEISKDPATKDKGGNLGWMSRNRLPTDFAEPVFLLEKNKPALVQTKLGWHLVEVTARKPAEPRSFQQAEPEIRAALEATKRHQAVEDLRKQLRQSTSTKIQIF